MGLLHSSGRGVGRFRHPALSVLTVAGLLLAGPATLRVGTAGLSANLGAVEYQVVSVDVEGNPTSFNNSLAWEGKQVFAPYSVSSDGSKVVFVKTVRVEDVAMAVDQRCNPFGYCTDIFVRDLASGTTRSVVSRLKVDGVHNDPTGFFSFATVGTSGGRWAVSSDANTFLYQWQCNRAYDDHGEAIAGTAFCLETGTFPLDNRALVLFDLDSGYTEVLSFTDYPGQYYLDISADGNTAVFDTGGVSAPTNCIRPGWNCQAINDRYLSVWQRGKGLTAIAPRQGTIPSGPYPDAYFNLDYPDAVRVSGDGSTVFILGVADSEWNGSYWESKRLLLAYDVADATFAEIPLPSYLTGPEVNTRWMIKGSSLDGDTLIIAVIVFPNDEYLLRIDVPTAQVSVLEDANCEAGWSPSVSADARYVACRRSNAWLIDRPGSPAVVDTVTGEVTEFATVADGFKKWGYLGPYLSGDGSTAVLLTTRDDGGGQVWAVTLGELPPAGGTFSDDDGSVFEADIEWMADAGITKGCNPPSNSLFCPDSVVTRGQMAAFLVRALGLTDRLDDPFTDDDGSIFEADIERLATAGITKGCNPPVNDRFCPDSKVTREQMAAFLVRALGYTDAGGSNLFVDDDTSIFEADIDRLATAGVTKGCNPPVNDRFCPTGYVTRGQMAAFLHRALG